jgi:multiple sugar transport system permease protein
VTNGVSPHAALGYDRVLVSLPARRPRRPPRGALAALPAAIAFALWSVLPLAAVVRYATWRWRGWSEPEPAGAANFLRLATDPDLLASLTTTVAFAAITLPAFVGLSLAIALAIHETRWERFVKALLFAPGLLTVGASAIAWTLLYHPDFGVFVELLGVALPWTTAPWAALAYVAAFTLWQQTGYGVLVVSAALRTIPRDALDAARIDGADEGALRRRIVLPLLRPTLLFLVVVGTVFALQSYTAVLLLTGGGPYGATRVLGYYLYETAFVRFDLGYGAAVTLFVAAITVVVAAAQARLLTLRGAGA